MVLDRVVIGCEGVSENFEGFLLHLMIKGYRATIGGQNEGDNDLIVGLD